MRNAKAFSAIVAAVSAVSILIGCNPQPPAPPAPAAPAPAPVASTASVSGPVPGTRLMEDYVRRVGAVAYLWGWPMVNLHNRKLILSQLPEPGLMGGIVPVAPINQL